LLLNDTKIKNLNSLVASQLFIQGHPSPKPQEEDQQNEYHQAKDEVEEVVEEEEIEMVRYYPKMQTTCFLHGIFKMTSPTVSFF